MKKITSLLLVSLALFSISCEKEEGPVTRVIDETGKEAGKEAGKETGNEAAGQL